MSTDPAVYARLREIADQLPQVPGIGKIEIADGQIVMMMSPVPATPRARSSRSATPSPSARGLSTPASCARTPDPAYV
ncbi:hypothetical protein ACWGB8_37880, partial [Kitasatospora sp. NPDC054939]